MSVTKVRNHGLALPGLPSTLPVLAVILLAPIGSTGTVYPYSVVPGGLPADHVLAHDQCLYLGMRFGGQLFWTDHCVWLKAGEKMAGTRRARCGNPTASHLPPGAKTLPPGLHFLVPLMERPVPNIVAPPQTTLTELTWNPPAEQTQVPELLPPGEETVIYQLPSTYFFLPPVAPGSLPLCKHKPCKPPHGGPLPTPEPSSVWLLFTGLFGLAALFAAHLRSAHLKVGPPSPEPQTF